jgi:ribonucrease Y
MTGLLWALLAVVLVLAAVVAGALVWAARTVSRLQERLAVPGPGDTTGARPDRSTPAASGAGRKADQEAGQEADREAGREAGRGAALADARRVLKAARDEADAVLERAHRQAEQDAEHIRVAARHSGER